MSTSYSGAYAKAASLFGDVIEAVFDLGAVEADLIDADLMEAGARLSSLLAAGPCG